MAFIRSPDNISIELIQKGGALAPRRAMGVDGRTPASGEVSLVPRLITEAARDMIPLARHGNARIAKLSRLTRGRRGAWTVPERQACP